MFQEHKEHQYDESWTAGRGKRSELLGDSRGDDVLPSANQAPNDDALKWRSPL